ncbi:MAG: 16S rRNA (cytidine(1402)-2'-O)-methyltransferase, partial [Alicyclobacillus sp.]|nr:16S rRNA (cytidine(1402)-2'-O)-methyltransferase [Alicyclobacillus sp.]
MEESVAIQSSFADDGPKLYLCSTPIGNLDDATFRLVRTLSEADVIAAEDTRHTRKLLSHFDIHPRLLVSYHEHNVQQRADDFVRWWSEGKTIALVTDAGTPGISDPGEHAAALAIAHHVPVVPVPGANAVLSALIASGLPCQPFLFMGFWPRDQKSVSRTLDWLATATFTVVIYESPHRIVKTLATLADAWPHRACAVARELTKRHETFIRGELTQVATAVRAGEARGEFVLVLGPAEAHEASVDDAKVRESAHTGGAGSPEERWQTALRLVSDGMAAGLPHAAAVRLAAEQTGVHRK